MVDKMIKFLKKLKLLKKKNIGAILIEFAFAIPVLIAILYFIMDAPLLRLYQLKLKNTAYFAANLIQNISDQRENKTISKKDLNQITICAFANLYRGLSIFNPNHSQYGHIYAYYVVGDDNDKATVKWVWDSGEPGTNPNNPTGSNAYTSGTSINNSIVKFSSAAVANTIHKDLTIKKGEVKIILDVSIIIPMAATYVAPTTQINQNNAAAPIARSDEIRHSPAGRLGFYLIPVKNMRGTVNSFLNYVLIFSPKPGLFSATPPPAT